ncbi:MAG: hypothetical protein ACOH1P_12620 [Lysobacter sp.]
MNDANKDHALGSGAGAVAGAIAGAAVGAVGGPVGMALGAVAGGVVGGKAGESVAAAAQQERYRSHFQREYSNAPYYAPDRSWEDYEPAYQYAFDAHALNPGQAFEQVETQLRHGWKATVMSWEQARPAVRDGWNYIEAATSGKDVGGL